jgi:hypothetical protein
MHKNNNHDTKKEVLQKMMKKIIWLFSMFFTLGVFSQPLIAEEAKKEDVEQ